MLDPELRRTVDQLWQKFWSNGLPNPLTAIDQLNHLIFLKRVEEMDNRAAKQAEAVGTAHVSVFEGGPTDEKRWSVWRHWSAEQMFDHVKDAVFPWLKSEVAPGSAAFREVMRDAAFLIPKASLLVEAVTVIDELRILDRNVDTQGDIYEYMLGRLNVAGQIGQFRTPRHLIRAMVELMDPQPGEVITDPACGTAGFLIAAYQHILAQNTSPDLLDHDDEGNPRNLYGDLLTQKERDFLNGKALMGSDFDRQMVRIAAMNMALHGISTPQVRYADALGSSFPHKPICDVLLANPPFSGSLDPTDVSEEFTLGTTQTELLFVELFTHLMRPGARAAVVVPEGVLFDESSNAHKALRRELVEAHGLWGIVSLPSGVFKPYAAASTAILLFQRDGTTEDVWFYDVTADGYTLDDKREPTGHSDLPDMIARWGDRSEGPRSFLVNKAEIAANDYDLSPRTYAAFVFEHEDMPAPTQVMKEMREDLDRLTDLLQEIESAL